MERFRPINKINIRLQKILIFDIRNSGFYDSLIMKAASSIGAYVSIMQTGWNVEERIKDADLVIGYGRCIIEAMAMGKCAIVYGLNGGDGYVDSVNYEKMMQTNFSGWSIRSMKQPENISIEEIITELKKYNSTDGNRLFKKTIANYNMNSYIEQIIC